MRYINKNSNRGIVNSFADFILTQINTEKNYDTVIEVTDCGKFFIVNGMTSSPNMLNMSDIKDLFYTENEFLLKEFGYESINVIDLIMYDNELVKKEEFWFTFYDTVRPLYSKSIINFIKDNSKNIKYHSLSTPNKLLIELDYSQSSDSLIDNFEYSPLNISSEFPYGYSLSMGRLHMYYAEYICNQLFSIVHTDKIKIKVSTVKDNDDDFNIQIESNSIFLDGNVKSMVLDVFDFNLNKFKNILDGYNIKEDLEFPFNTKPWLVRDRQSDLILF